jgi:hypothetical protein
VINVNPRNPLLRSTFIVFTFWWIVLTIIALGKAGLDFNNLEIVAGAALASLAATVVGTLVGFFGRLAWRSAYSITNESMLKKGGQWNGAISRLGQLPGLEAPKMAALPANIGELAPWLSPMRQKFPQHAAAAEAVIRVMLTVPTLPASPVPGGHGNRTLLAHSLGVVESMLEQAPKWVYRGQFSADGKELRVPPKNGEHRFTPDDFGLLILTALSHDIGKIVCYKLVGKNAVQEVKPNHDAEGGKLLRRMPEVMALSLRDRRALLTACSFYHRPFDMPLVEWCDDRVRSLTELLIVADHVTGRKEGHQLRQAQAPIPDEAKPAVTDLERKTAAAIGAAIGKNIEALEGGEDLFDAEARMAEAIPDAPEAKDVAVAPWETGETTEASEEDAAAESGNALISGLYRFFGKRPELINGANTSHRFAFKCGNRVYVDESRLRSAIQMSEWDTGFSQSLLGQTTRGRDANPFTKALLTALSDVGYLLQAIDVPGENRVARFSAANSLFNIRTQVTKSKAPAQNPNPFFVIPAAPFGLEEFTDWPFDVALVKPHFGWDAEAGKLRPERQMMLSFAIERGVPEAAKAEDPALSENAPADATPPWDTAPVSNGEIAAKTKAEEPQLTEASGEAIGDDDIPGFEEGASHPAKPTLGELLVALYGEIDASDMAPIKVLEDGTRLFYADGAAGGLVARFLERHRLTEADFKMTRKTGGTGREVLMIPKP